jgi:DNA primase
VIAQDFIDELLARTDIVEVIQPRVVLKKTGQNFSGLCPFHQEKSPSFNVSQEKQFYYCFGCQASGTALKFLMEYDRLDFIAAIELLAGMAGLQVPQSSPGATPERIEHRKSIYQILDQSADFFQRQLKEHEKKPQAIEYLKGRGLSGAIARDFGLGYAPPGWDNLYRDQAKTNLEHDLLIESGMVIRNDDDDKTYDRFRDRIMFPIRDFRGRVIAFGGRILGDGQPKYLNSPETPVFHKGRELYGLFEARKRTKKLTQLLVVEGYMDVVALAQYEINYAVATLGTATSSEHLERMFRVVSRVVFCFDGDKAGRNAAWKALTVTLPLMSDGQSARFLFLPDGEDPDSLVRKEGKEKFETRLSEAQPLSEFFFNKLQMDIDMRSMDGKAEFSNLAMPMIKEIPAGVFKQLMIEQLSSVTGLSADKLIAASAASPPKNVARASPSVTPPAAPLRVSAPTPRWEKPEVSRLAELALAMLLRQPELAQQFDELTYSRLEKTPECQLLLAILYSILQGGVSSPVMLLSGWQDKPEFDLLRDLIEQEQLLNVSELPEEFSGVIKSLIRLLEIQSEQQLRADLLSKTYDEMTSAEREMLLKLVKIGPQR